MNGRNQTNLGMRDPRLKNIAEEQQEMIDTLMARNKRLEGMLIKMNEEIA